MTDGGEIAESDTATADDLGDRIAALRARMASLEESITGQTATTTLHDKPDSATDPAPSTSPSQSIAADVLTPTAAPEQAPPQQAPPQREPVKPQTPAASPVADQPAARAVQIEPIRPAPGVDPDDPVLALGVADPDALDAWLTDEIAVIDPSATGEQEPVTAEMDAITKPSVYDTLAPDDRREDGLRRGVTVEAVSLDEQFEGLKGRQWLTLLVVAAVLIGMAVVVAIWLSSQPDGGQGLILMNLGDL